MYNVLSNSPTPLLLGQPWASRGGGTLKSSGDLQAEVGKSTNEDENLSTLSPCPCASKTTVCQGRGKAELGKDTILNVTLCSKMPLSALCVTSVGYQICNQSQGKTIPCGE